MSADTGITKGAGPWSVGSGNSHYMREVRDSTGRGVLWCGIYPEEAAHAIVRTAVHRHNVHDALVAMLRRYMADDERIGKTDSPLYREASQIIAEVTQGAKP